MAYTPTTWNDGDVITAEKMNKLEQGVQNQQTGAPGAAAGFGTPTATVDANVGTPSVTVTASGANTEKVFNFDFKNLKGEKGDPGAKGAKGDKGDTYVLPAANKTTLGGVKQMNLIGDLTTETTADLKNKVNAIIAELKRQGIMASA